MGYIIAGLGNPGEEYNNTRHNIGRIVVERFAKEMGADFLFQKNHKAWEAKGKLDKESILLTLPDTFMNNSGRAIAPLVKNIKACEKLVVVHDDLDIPFGKMKMVFNRGSGGHNGVESIRKSLKTSAFMRVRIGVATTTPSGKIKKPKGEDAVIKFILGKFSTSEEKELKKIIKHAVSGLALLVEEGRDRAMNNFNTS